MLYELSLKYNTLKMYENTLEQMRENGNSNSESYKKILEEMMVVEDELANLLNPSLPTENEFVKEVNKNAELTDLYDIRKDFFNSIVKPVESVSNTNYDKLKKPEYKKTAFADIQDKISTSRWINRSNFIVRFPLDVINIPEWRVASFYYNRHVKGGDMYVNVYDFSEMNEDGTYNILSAIIMKLSLYKEKTIGDILVDVVGNDGKPFYRLLFTNCYFKDAEQDSFAYNSNELMTFNMHFSYDGMLVIPPNNEAAN